MPPRETTAAFASVQTMGLLVALRIPSRLTVKLRGRTEAPDTRRGRTLSPSARGAYPQTHHGPLQRLLGVLT
jgi:hypothetical protein